MHLHRVIAEFDFQKIQFSIQILYSGAYYLFSKNLLTPVLTCLPFEICVRFLFTETISNRIVLAEKSLKTIPY